MSSLRRKRCKDCGRSFLTATPDTECQDCSGKYAGASDATAEHTAQQIAKATLTNRPDQVSQQVNPRGPNATEPAPTASSAPKPKRAPTQKAAPAKKDD